MATAVSHANRLGFQTNGTSPPNFRKTEEFP